MSLTNLQHEPTFVASDAFLATERFTHHIGSLIIPCQNGEIHINFSNGSVELKDCNPDDAARAFWEKVTEAFPDFRRTVLEGK